MTLVSRLLVSVALATLGLAETVTAQTVLPRSTAGQTAVTQNFLPEGTWSGTSKCTAEAAICEDYTIVIRVTDDAQPLQYDADISILDNGVETLDRHLVMTYDGRRPVLTVRFLDDRKRLTFYALAVKGDRMAGVLLVNDHAIERILHLQRTSATATPVPWAKGDGASASASAASPQ